MRNGEFEPLVDHTPRGAGEERGVNLTLSIQKNTYYGVVVFFLLFYLQKIK